MLNSAQQSEQICDAVGDQHQEWYDIQGLPPENIVSQRADDRHDERIIEHIASRSQTQAEEDTEHHQHSGGKLQSSVQLLKRFGGVNLGWDLPVE